MVLGAGPPIICRNSRKTHLKLSTCSSHISMPERMILWKWLFTPTKAQTAMSYRFSLYVVSTVTTSPKNQYCIRLLPFVHIKVFTLLSLSARICKVWVPCNNVCEHFQRLPHIIISSLSAYMFMSVLFVNGTFSTKPKTLPIMLYTFPRFTLFSLSCFIRSLV